MKKVSFKVAKAIKNAGYPQEWYNTEYYYDVIGELKHCDDYEWNNLEDIMYYQRLAIPAPTYIEVWLWLWKEKDIKLSVEPNDDETECYTKDLGRLISEFGSNPEEAIIPVIDYLVDNDLIK